MSRTRSSCNDSNGDDFVLMSDGISSRRTKAHGVAFRKSNGDLLASSIL